MSDRLGDVEGIGPANAAKLAEQGVATTDDLLSRGGRPAGRAALAERTGISEKLILEWVNHADLFRIRGIAGQFADLLEEAGVDTVVELARRNPANLATALAETNAVKNLTNRVPSATEVADWVAQAGALPRAVFYDDAGGQDSHESGAAAAASERAPEPSSASAAPADVGASMGMESDAAVAPPAVPVASGERRDDALEATAGARSPAPRTLAAPAVAPDNRGWLTRLIDRIRGR